MVINLKRYIRGNSEVNLRGNSKSYFRNIQQILQDKAIILDHIDDIENSELSSIMNHKDGRHDLIRSIVPKLGYKLQPGNNVVCYLYAVICFIIFKYRLHQNPVIVLGSLDPNLTEILHIMHVWCECDNKIYDYPKANSSFEYTPIVYFDGSQLKSAIDSEEFDS